jgi:hypothetical protein
MDNAASERFGGRSHQHTHMVEREDPASPIAEV